jgi:hypothetical protein
LPDGLPWVPFWYDHKFPVRLSMTEVSFTSARAAGRGGRVPRDDGEHASRGAERRARGREGHDPQAVPAALAGRHPGRDGRGRAGVAGVAVQQVTDDVFIGGGHCQSFHSMLSVVVKRAARPGEPRKCAMAREDVLLTVPTEMPSSAATSASLRSSK